MSGDSTYCREFLDCTYDEALDIIGESYVRAWLRDGVASYDLSDPVVRLGVIVELRRMGYSVESGGA